MRKQTIAQSVVPLFLSMIGVPYVHTQTTSSKGVAFITLTLGVDVKCIASIADRAVTTQIAPTQILTVSCGGKRVFEYSTQDALVDTFINYPHNDRLFARWEGGSHVRFTVIHIDAHGDNAKVVFDKQLEGTPDVIDTPDCLLVHSGKRWLDGSNTSLPTSTSIFRWNGVAYSNPETWTWKESMRFEDRFCVLDPSRLSCPVIPADSKPIK